MYKYCIYAPNGKSLFGWEPLVDNNILRFHAQWGAMNLFPAGYYVELAGLAGEHLCTIHYGDSDTVPRIEHHT